jgi:transcriptional regulator
MSAEVIGIDGLTDQQCEGARLAATGWRGVDIADHLDVASETVSRWRKKAEYIAAIEAILSEVRSEVAGRMVELADKALDVIDETLDHAYDRSLKLRAAVALLQISGIGRAMSTAASTKGASTSESAASD